MRIDKALKLYLAHNTRVTSESTLNHYHITMRQYQALCGTRLRHLNDDNLVRFMRWLKDSGRAPATVNQKRDYVCAFWRWLAKRGYVRRWPTVAAIREPEVIPEAWTIGQLDKILDACGAQTGLVDGVQAAAWWTSIHLFWFYHGERLSATLSALWKDYDGRTLLIPAHVRKGGQKAMLYQLIPQVQEAIERIRHPERELIWPWTPCDFHYHYNRRILKTAGLIRTRGKSGPHKMRRSFASHLEAAGGDACKALKQSKSSLTRKSYIDPRIAKPVNQSTLLPRVG